MKFLHLSDLHIGKKVNGISMLEEQRFVLESAIKLIKDEKISFVLIAGDVFDRAIPSVEAMELFDYFLLQLNKLEIKTYIISGNHDNMDRLSYLSDLLHKSNIYISKPYTGKIECYTTDDINIYLMPYLYPMLVRKYHSNCKISNYSDAIEIVIKDLKLNSKKINILIAHQFVVSSKKPILSESEQKSAGGVDEINYKIFKKFDYVALGHLHCPQKVGVDKIRYGGSILKYSFSEINQKKSFCVVDVQSKDNIKISLFPIFQRHDMKEYRGYISEFLNKDFYSKINTDDYIHFTLLDENVIDAKSKLSLVYPNIMLLDFDNSFTKKLNDDFKVNLKEQKTLVEHFYDFYSTQFENKPDDIKKKIVIDVYNSILKEDECAL